MTVEGKVHVITWSYPFFIHLNITNEIKGIGNKRKKYIEISGMKECGYLCTIKK